MQFTYDEFCGNETLEIKDEIYNYLIKARRHKIDDEIYFRNLKDEYIYLYKISFIDKKKALLNLLSKEEKVLENEKKLHLGWCIVDPKTIEKYITSLNEIGIEKITFIYSDFSQKNFKINIEKLEKILDVANTELAEQPYLSGSHFGVADIPLALALNHWFNLDVERQHDHTHLKAWIERIRAREHFL